MSAISSILNDMLGPIGSIVLIGSLGLVMIVVAIGLMAIKPRDPFDRVKSHDRRATDSIQEQALRDRGSDPLKRFATYLEPQDASELGDIRQTMMRAGYRGASAVRIYYFAQMALGLGCAVLGGLLLFATDADKFFDPVTFVKNVLLPGVLGYLAPKYWITRRVASRNELISQGFPDSLDMMLVCVEAGQSLDQAIVRVASEMRSGFPDLADEFEIVAQQMKAGRDKTQVLRDMAARIDNDDVSSFVTTLVQSQSYGTPISEALRVYATEMREKRVMRAEEKANKLPTKMSMATMTLTVPPLLLILIGPSLINIGKLVSGGL